ncbi:DNA mismatch repair protein MutS [Peptoanaerobacter stomatis]|uniref:DNA mismatch repair protein MutS n=1 Tax=Peptoanaerobacter stomatis TaxID=796937 RepID=J6HH05_9FIRM|nr:DNA mismatch repair protein MutS [Peptoanaerobacter stomatis]EJU21978.1 DNA mismatch repair protein MutS [Peptoanaerobacter stomatis]NWO24830.1 DNA mismatch repair protein MutS [Peptostreptococcaceae bacterium oral taxon 081]
MENLTPMMKQYLEIKNNNKGSILFFRLGDFYEMFFDDAIETSKLLEITLTGKACGNGEKAPMCGVPYHSAKSYIQKLINFGKKVAICEQVEDPKDAKGIVKRDVVKIITPGTVLDDDMIEGSSNNYIMAIITDEDIVYMTYADITTGEVNNITTTYQEVSNIFFSVMPSEIIMDDIFLKKMKENSFKNSKIINNFLIENNVVQNTANYENIEEFISDNNLADKIPSLIQIYKYVYDTQKFFDINFFYEKNQVKYMSLDYYTIKNLELIESIRKNNSYTLFWVLNKANTSMGSRLLKQYLLKPLNDENEIRQRLNKVSSFVEHYSVSTGVSHILREVYDLERISNRIVYDTVSHRDLLNLKKSLKAVNEIKNIFKGENDSRFEELYEVLSKNDLMPIINLIEKSIEEIGEDFKKEHIIKSSYDEKLAYYRDLLENTSNILIKMERDEREKTGIKNLKISYNKVFGYYIEITKAALQNFNMPSDYERRQTLVSSERFINNNLKKIEEEMLSAKQGESQLESSLYKEVKEELKNFIPKIMQVAEMISQIDVYTALAKTAIENDYVKPMISTDGNIVIKNGRHPVIEKLLPNEEYVPNDTDLTSSETHIITGPNMAGKSTYMRQVAIIMLMAHIGSYVPASFAQIPIIDSIYTRIGASDDLSMGQSTFMVEMTEVSNILKNATQNSLIILDEIGRGTSTYDGMSLAFSIVEYICEHIKAKTLVSTHYHELTALESKYKNIKNYCMLVDDSKEIKFLRKIVLGKADKSYGIHVAQLADLPYEVLERANIILSKLETSEKKSSKKYNQKSEQDQVSIENFSKDNNLRIVQKIKDLNIDEYTPRQAMDLLYKIKSELR